MRDSNLVISLGRWFVIASITIHVFLVIVWFQGILIMRGLEEIESQVANIEASFNPSSTKSE